MSLFDEPTTVDADETPWYFAHIVRLEFARIDQRMRRNPLWTIHPLARWALLGRDQFGESHLLATNAEQINLLRFARAIASAADAELVEPDATCKYCASPVPVGVHHCLDTDCWLLDGQREYGWRAA